MTLKICEAVSIMLAALVTGVFWGPWVGLTKNIADFEPDVFLAVVNRLAGNLGRLMTVLMPMALISTVVVLIASYQVRPAFYFDLAGFCLYLAALAVTVRVEVPITLKFVGRTTSTLPPDWTRLRDRWVAYHAVRVLSSVVGLAMLVIGAIS